MKKTVVLSEVDLVQVVANSFSVSQNNVSLRHYKESIGYGYSEEEVDRVEITVHLPVKDQKEETP